MLVVCFAVIFSLVSMSQTAPSSKTCERLLKPLATTDSIFGKWSLLAMSNNRPGLRTFNELFTENIWWEFLPGELHNKINANSYAKIVECGRYNATLTVEGNQLSWTYIPSLSSTAVLLPTCPDCLVSLITSTINGNVYTALRIFSKRRVLTDDEMLEFDTQIECLKLPPRYTVNPKEDLCPANTQPFPETNDFKMALLDFMEMNAVKKILRTTDNFFERRYSAVVLNCFQRVGQAFDKVKDWFLSFL
ncbi:uncharacterized protein LOC105008187 [Esox lucius]|uniref:uncharacterized protein LOC105008187 n=1 Tax=Esox lucius TaxID=8010 RepID=UPI000576AEC8|nr:uncharacterized protein LOC105008187 [Esox lucius]